MNLQELKVLLALNGNNRLLHLESELFSSKKLYKFYLESICSKYSWYDDHYDSKDSSDLAWLAYRYADNVIKGKWVEAESLIARDSRWALWYAERVIRDRWPEAESVIATDRFYADWYNDKFGTKL